MDIEGWIEVARLPDLSDEYAWFGTINLSAIVDVADSDSELLFGISKACASGEINVQPLAADRGLPPNPSAELQHDLQTIATHEKQYGNGEIGGYTYASWAEIQHFSVALAPDNSQWALPFALAHLLEKQYGADRVRFVVWYNW
jgi:hypothetical protein